MAVVSRSAAGQPHRKVAYPARGRLYGISDDAISGAGRGVENIHLSASVVYSGDGGGGGFGSWCGCLSGSGRLSPPPSGRRNGDVGHGGEGGEKLVSGSFEGRRRSSTSPGKVSPVTVEVAPPVGAVQAASKEMAAAVISMSNLGVSNSVDSGVAIDPVVKSKASPTLFEMMTHEQGAAKPGHSISLSQQLTFQEKMKSLLSGNSAWRI